MSSGVAVVAGRLGCVGAGGALSTSSLPPAGAGRVAGVPAGAVPGRGRLGGGGGGGHLHRRGPGGTVRGRDTDQRAGCLGDGEEITPDRVHALRVGEDLLV